MKKAAPIATERTRLDKCAHGMQSMGIWSLTTGDGGSNRGYRPVRGAREGRIGSKNLVRTPSE